jgi:invasion protein IalB
VKITLKLAILAAIASFGPIGFSLAQQAPKSKGPAQVTPAPAPAPSPSGTAAAAPPAPPGWAAHCNSVSRDASLECTIEQNAILTKTGQVLVLVVIRVPGDTRAPLAFVQLPLGLNLQTGAKFQVDDGKAVDLPIQTCENRGCYASAPVTPELLTALKSGKQLKVSFQDLAKETITIPMPLNDFAAAYDKIK